jgi:2-keto-4-pentenoate hydratase/2-oxohepta-3-ene-1,7-dioic acid hydratase in catechol pathway
VRIASFRCRGRVSYGIVTADGIVDVGGRDGAPPGSLGDALAADSLEGLGTLAAEDPDFAMDEVEFLPVVTRPDKILCVGINYRPHVEETGREAPRHPVLFVRFPGSLVGHGQPLVRPSASGKFDYEGELAVIVGRRGRHIDRDRALEHVAGYACFNDGSVRDFQRHSSQFTAGKNFAGSGSFGPWLTTADDVGDPSRLTLETRLNGEVMQSAKVADLIFDVPELIAYCSIFTELLPGDVIVTGTPGGVGYVRKPPVYLTPGDEVEVDIPGVGLLRNGVVDEGSETAEVSH